MADTAVTAATQVDPSNDDARRAWDGNDGDYWTDNESTFDTSVARYTERFLEAAAIEAGDHVLDVGCGTGETTRQAARLATAGSALGVDLSSRMLERARRRAAEAGVTNARFEQADAQIHPFAAGAFDVAISRTGAMFFGDPVAAFANIGRALRPGGRLDLLVWQPAALNDWFREFTTALAAGRALPSPPPGAPGPFSLGEPDRVHSILSDAGYAEVELTGVNEPMWFGSDADDAYRFVRGLGVAQFLLRDLDDATRARAQDALRATIDAHETNDGVVYPSAAWIVTATRA